MCGIVGALSFDGSPFRVTSSYIEKMRDSMSHRGPDGAGIWTGLNGRVGLGHRRLSIIDLSEKAAQPMSNEDGSIWIVYNGEIYNHVALRTELERSGGHAWKTDHSDTEMILHAYEQWGVECLGRFRGMFAFGLWDGRARELWLVRDRIGVKPLYYSIHNGRITFASEIKALLEDPGQRREVDEEAFYHYLSFLTAPAPMTMFAGIRKLPGGTWLRVRCDGNVLETRYWDAWDNVQPQSNISEEEISSRIIHELQDSVRYRKVSDVPVGVFLSGGIDSSINAVLFSEGEKHRAKTFTIGYKGDYPSYPNELEFARLVANQVGAEHHELLLDVDDLIDFLPSMVFLQDEPIADPVCVPIYYVSKLARENGVVVCQVGEGADELFYGYPYWRTIRKLGRWNDLPFPGVIKKMGLRVMDWAGMEERFSYEWLRRGLEGVPIFWGGAEAFAETQKKRLLGPRLREKFSAMTSWEAIRPIRKRFEEKCWDPSILHWMTYLDLNLRLPELLLMRVDKMTMGVSLEGRVPFLDHKFVELVLGISSEVKTRNDDLKYILKRAVRGRIPDSVIDRKKQGFSVPIHEWLYEKLGDKIVSDLKSFFNKTDYFDREYCLKYMGKKEGIGLWYIYNFSLWWEKFIDRSSTV